MTDTLTTEEEPQASEHVCEECPDRPTFARRDHLTRHQRTQHGQKDAPPARRGRKPKGAPKQPAIVSTPPLRQQIEMVYRLGGQVVAARGMPVTGGVVNSQAPACAEAWDQLLDQYFPGVKEFLEKGMVAGSVIALIYAHIPIIHTARMEIQARQEQQQSYEPPVGSAA